MNFLGLERNLNVCTIKVFNAPNVLLMALLIMNNVAPRVPNAMRGLSCIDLRIPLNLSIFLGSINHVNAALTPTPAKNNFPKFNNLSKILANGLTIVLPIEVAILPIFLVSILPSLSSRFRSNLSCLSFESKSFSVFILLLKSFSNCLATSANIKFVLINDSSNTLTFGVIFSPISVLCALNIFFNVVIFFSLLATLPSRPPAPILKVLLFIFGLPLIAAILFSKFSKTGDDLSISLLCF